MTAGRGWLTISTLFIPWNPRAQSLKRVTRGLSPWTAGPESKRTKRCSLSEPCSGPRGVASRET